MAHDGSSIKAITILTMIFLPGTFVAVCLSECLHDVNLLNFLIGNILESSLWGEQIRQHGIDPFLLAIHRFGIGVHINHCHAVVLSSPFGCTVSAHYRKVETSSEGCV